MVEEEVLMVRSVSVSTRCIRIWAVLVACLCFIPQGGSAEGPIEAQGGGSAKQTETGLNPEPDYPTFSKDSFWYKPIPKNVPLHEKSDEFSKEFARQVKTYYGHIAIAFEDYSSPLYVAKPDTQNVTVTLWDCARRGKTDQKLQRDFTSVPVPTYAEPAGGSDSEMSVYQPSTDRLWEFWKARKVEGSWQACWGGRMSDVSKNPGIWPWPYGAAATGLPFAAGQLRASELAQGSIQHVMGIAIVNEEEKTFSWPANRTDGSNWGKVAHPIPEGLRLRLDPTVDVESLNLHPIAKAIAKAAQVYGFVVWDHAGAVTLRAENPKRFTQAGLPNPYPALFAGTRGYALMNRFPWDKMQFLPMDYGKPQ